MKTPSLTLLIPIILGPLALAQSVGGGGGRDRPGFAPSTYSRSSLCAANEWKVDWESTSNINDHERSFWTCETKRIPVARSVRNPSNGCVETGKAQPVTVPTANGRSVMKWEICKGGKYVIYDP